MNLWPQAAVTSLKTLLPTCLVMLPSSRDGGRVVLAGAQQEAEIGAVVVGKLRPVAGVDDLEAAGRCSTSSRPSTSGAVEASPKMSSGGRGN